MPDKGTEHKEKCRINNISDIQIALFILEDLKVFYKPLCIHRKNYTGDTEPDFQASIEHPKIRGQFSA